jgi:hypothetical protein
MPSKINEIAAERYSICQSCDQFNSTFKSCKDCGCFMPAKVLLKFSKCPLGKWGRMQGEENG